MGCHEYVPLSRTCKIAGKHCLEIPLSTNPIILKSTSNPLQHGYLVLALGEIL